MNYFTELLAFTASMIGVGGSIPQIIKILRTKDTTALSVAQYSMSLVSSFLWILYGVLTPLYSLIFWGSLAALSAVVVLILKFYNEGHFKRFELPPMHFFTAFEPARVQALSRRRQRRDVQLRHYH